MMSGAKHTPGTYRVEEGTSVVWGDCDPEDSTSYGMGYPITDCRITPSGLWAKGPKEEEGLANARLFAAAPELLEALKHARNQIQHPDQLIDEAIAKAEGTQS